MKIVSVFAILLFAGIAQADPKKEASAKASISLAIALDSKATPVCPDCGCGCIDGQPCRCKKKGTPTKRQSYGDGIRESLRTGKPLIVHVGGLDCGNVCQEVDAVTCESPIAFGDSTPRLVLLVNSGGTLRFVGEWKGAPAASTIKQAISAPVVAPVVAPDPALTPVQVSPVNWGVYQPVTAPPTIGYRSSVVAPRQLNLQWSGPFSSGQICVGGG